MKLVKKNGRFEIPNKPSNERKYGLQWFKRTKEGLRLNFYFGSRSRLVIICNHMNDAYDLILRCQTYGSFNCPNWMNFENWLNSFKNLKYEILDRSFELKTQMKVKILE